jgi:cation transport regulator ChaB
MPDFKKVLTEDLFNQGYRAILAGLGFIDVIQGITSTRKEAVLNPAPFVEETNDGVEGFKSVLMEIIHLIVQRNAIDHKKLFNREKQLYIASTPLKLNTQQILSELRLGYVYGVNSIKSYQLALGLNPDIEKEQTDAEWENGDRSRYYPHIVQNLEQNTSPEEDIVPVKAPKTQKPPISNKQIEKDIEKTGNPNLKYKMKSSEEPTNEEAGLPEGIEDAPYKSLDVLPAPVQKLSKHLQQTWLDVFNKTYKGKDTEKKAFRVAWSVINKMRGKV